MTLNGSDIKDISRMLTDNICVDMIKVEIDELWSFVKIKRSKNGYGMLSIMIQEKY